MFKFGGIGQCCFKVFLNIFLFINIMFVDIVVLCILYLSKVKIVIRKLFIVFLVQFGLQDFCLWFCIYSLFGLIVFREYWVVFVKVFMNKLICIKMFRFILCVLDNEFFFFMIDFFSFFLFIIDFYFCVFFGLLLDICIVMLLVICCRLFFQLCDVLLCCSMWCSIQYMFFKWVGVILFCLIFDCNKVQCFFDVFNFIFEMEKNYISNNIIISFKII